MFVSYAHSDREFCLRLREALGRRGKHVFLDESDIPPAARWERDLQIAIESADSFVFVLSSSSVASVECLKELDYAGRLNKRIVPVKYRQLRADAVPDSLGALQFVPRRGEFEQDFERLWSC